MLSLPSDKMLPKLRELHGLMRDSLYQHVSQTAIEAMSIADRYEGGDRYGKVIVIEHPNGWRSLYAHLDQRSVQVGGVVAAGQPIGLSGASGEVTGPHLHFEVIDGAGRIDPASLIAGLDANAWPAALRKRDQPQRR